MLSIDIVLPVSSCTHRLSKRKVSRASLRQGTLSRSSVSHNLHAQLPPPLHPWQHRFPTWVTHQRAPLFKHADNVTRLRQAVSQMKTEAPFDIVAAVVLPDHIHFVWTLPDSDSNYSKRVGRIKVLFTQSLKGKNAQPDNTSESRRKHRESDVWQRRFWERTVRTEEDVPLPQLYSLQPGEAWVGELPASMAIFQFSKMGQ